jgi:hypothetical protein
MVRPAPDTSALMATLLGGAFSEEEIYVATGGAEVGQAFAGLAFDHLIFTGAASVARHVMRAAAANLVPLTLELGGKSPVILGRSADYATAAARIMNGKTLNGRRGFLPAGAPPHSPDPDHRSHRRDERDAGGNLRPGPAGEALQGRRRRGGLCERP